VRTVCIVPESFAGVSDWLEEQRFLWRRRLDQLDAYVKAMEAAR
jgi:hypothetical protein